MLKCVLFLYAAPPLNLVNAKDSQISIDTPKEDSAFSLRKSSPEVDFYVTHSDSGN